MKNLVIIGAGISGLTAGIYAQSSGFNVTILEQNHIAGGNCSYWKRKGHYIEGCLHWLTGSSEKEPLYEIWKEVGVIDDSVKIIPYTGAIFTMYYKNEIIYYYQNIEELKTYFLKISPEDKKAIETLCNDIKKFSSLSMPVWYIKNLKTENKIKNMSLKDFFKILPALIRSIKTNKISISEYLSMFKHNGIRILLEGLIPKENCATSLIATLATYERGDGAYLEGGSEGMVERMVKTFKDAGGTLLLNTSVEKILIDNKKVYAIKTKKQEEIPCDGLIISSDTIVALENFFEEPIKADWIDTLNKNFGPVLSSFISLSLKKDLSNFPETVLFYLDKPIEYLGYKIDTIQFRQYAKYNYAPDGCTTICITLNGNNYEKWKELKINGKYKESKKELGEIIVNAFYERFPEWKDLIEVLDIATPLTYERYCRTKHGGWMNYQYPGQKFYNLSGLVPDIPNLFFAGQKLRTPGGLPIALDTGHRAAQYACIYFDKVYKKPKK